MPWSPQKFWCGKTLLLQLYHLTITMEPSVRLLVPQVLSVKRFCEHLQAVRIDYTATQICDFKALNFTVSIASPSFPGSVAPLNKKGPSIQMVPNMSKRAMKQTQWSHVIFWWRPWSNCMTEHVVLSHEPCPTLTEL